MTTIFDELAELIIPELPYFCVGGTSYTCYRGNSNGVVTPQGLRTVYVVPTKPDGPLAALPQITIYGKPWVTFAELGTDIQSNDVLVSVDDPTYIFALLGRVTTFLSMLAAPTDETQLVT